MSFCDEHGTADYCGECVYGPEIEALGQLLVVAQAENARLQQQLAAAQAEISEWKEKDRHWELNSLSRIVEQRDAAQAEARNWKRIAEDATHVEREELTRVREIVSGMREYADSCDHPSEASKRNAVEYWLAQLEDALSQAAERESLPLMARRSWMRRDTDYCVVHGDFCLEIKALNGRAPYFDESGELVVCAEAGDSIERDQVDAEAQPDGIYRIADTDEHGLPVIPREPGMREGARYRGWTESTQRWSYYTRYIKRHAHDRFERIEDYRPAAQEGGDA